MHVQQRKSNLLGVQYILRKRFQKSGGSQNPHPLPVVEDVVRLLLLDTLVVLELVLRLVLLVLLLVPDVDVLVALVEDVAWNVECGGTYGAAPRLGYWEPRRIPQNREKLHCFRVCRLVKWIMGILKGR